MSVLNADSGLTTMNDNNHRFPWKWYLSDIQGITKNNRTVFSCFSCGGGSSMGYKLAGYTVLGNCEIDPDMNAIYNANHHPRYSFLMDIRDFAAKPDAEIPQELFNLDILDGSPPCSVFSTAGDRSAGWNKDKVFREGQKKQRLDDLFFAFIDVLAKLKPKVSVAENVTGLIKGNAKGYVNEILKAYDDAGYAVQLFLLNAAYAGVPQARERVFFIAHRKNLNYPKLKIAFNEPVITFGEVRSEHGVPYNTNTEAWKLMLLRRPEDKSLADVNKRERGKTSQFNNAILSDNRPACTLTSAADFYRMYDGYKLSKQDIINVQTFPQDYNFGKEQPKYVCGMSVPPVLMANIATEIYAQWLINDKQR